MDEFKDERTYVQHHATFFVKKIIRYSCRRGLLNSFVTLYKALFIQKKAHVYYNYSF